MTDHVVDLPLRLGPKPTKEMAPWMERLGASFPGARLVALEWELTAPSLNAPGERLPRPYVEISAPHGDVISSPSNLPPEVYGFVAPLAFALSDANPFVNALWTALREMAKGVPFEPFYRIRLTRHWVTFESMEPDMLTSAIHAHGHADALPFDRHVRAFSLGRPKSGHDGLAARKDLDTVLQTVREHLRSEVGGIAPQVRINDAALAALWGHAPA